MACDAAGAHAEIVDPGRWPMGDGVPVIVPPAEPLTWSAPTAAEGAVMLCLPRPGTPSYESGLSAPFGARVTLDRHTARRLLWLGVDAVDVPPGPCGEWMASQEAERDVDVLLLARYSDRRARILAGMARHMSRLRCQLWLTDGGPETPPFLPALLARSRIVLHIHDGEWPSFPWWLWLRAAANGAVLLTERACDALPLRAGAEFVSGATGSLGLLAAALVGDDRRRIAVSRAARDALSRLPPLAERVQALIAAASGLTPRATSVLVNVPAAVAKVEPSAPTRDPTARERKRRALDRLASQRAAAGAVKPTVVADTRTLRGPRVSVVMALFEHEEHVGEALTSVAESTWSDLELVVVDDGSSDASLDRVRGWIAEHEVQAVLLSHRVNQGLPRTRNAAIAAARGQLVFVLDSDNAVNPTGIEHLVEALEADREAAFAYGMLEMHEGDVSLGLRSRHPWEPERFAEGNPIDAMALIRKEWLELLGGYSLDDRLHGWEDYDLWCGIAERDGHGVFVPEIVGRYRVVTGSMLSLTDTSHEEAFEALRERHPVTFGRGRRP